MILTGCHQRPRPTLGLVRGIRCPFVLLAQPRYLIPWRPVKAQASSFCLDSYRVLARSRCEWDDERENARGCNCWESCMSNGETMRRHAKVIKSSSAQKLLTKHEGGKTSKLWDISNAGPLPSFMPLSYYHSNGSLISHLPTSTT